MRPTTKPAEAPADAGGPTGVTGALERLRLAVTEITELGFSGLGGSQLRDVAKGVTTQVTRLESVRAQVLVAAEASGVVEEAGARSGAAWLADATNQSPGGMKKVEKLGHALDIVPGLAEAMDAGRVGAEQAATLSNAAERGVLSPDELGQLVDDAARGTSGSFSRQVKSQEARTDQAQLRRDERLMRERRTTRIWTDDAGMTCGEFRLDPIDGAVIRAALAAMETPDPAGAPDELRRMPSQRRADALVDLARSVLDRGEAPMVRTVKPHITVTVPVTMFAESDQAAEAEGAYGLLPDGTTISARAARQLLCDARVRRLVIDPDGMPLDVGRATRSWSGAQRAALHAIDGGCRGPMCDRPPEWTDIHHIVWWRDDGATDLENGLLLCRACHTLVHDQAWVVTMNPSTREVTWTSGDGRRLTSWPRGPTAPMRP